MESTDEALSVWQGKGTLFLSAEEVKGVCACCGEAKNSHVFQEGTG
jgi:hypothetical protein